MKYFRIITISRILRQLHGGGSYDILHLHSDRRVVIISLILNEFSYSKAQITHHFIACLDEVQEELLYYPQRWRWCQRRC